MFAALAPLVKERSVHVLISAGADNRLAIYVEPVVKDKENCAFGSPFRCEASPEELDAQFAAVIAKWLNTRSSALKSLSEALAEAEASYQESC
jgi:PRTRC genetic system protein E